MKSDLERLREAAQSLNETQKQSVFSNATTLQILAGPGSGKTRVLTFRVAYLVLEKHIPPDHIIVVTFTTKAANEMKSRLFDLIGSQRTRKLLIGTFHALCSKLLHKYAYYADLDPSFTICDTDQSKDIIGKIKKDAKVKIDDFTRNKMTAGAVHGMISKAKNEGMNEVIYAQTYRDDFQKKHIAVIFTLYEEELRKQNLVDFDNLLLKAVVLLKRKNDAYKHVKCILVDEYQDTNVVQYDIIKLMVEQINNRTVTIVGDPDQSIFGWRSAEPKNFGKMAEDFSGTVTINMEQNYRSTSKVIESAMHVIKQDKKRIDKNLYTNNPEGVPISLISTHDNTSQAEFVAAEIKKAVIYSKGLIQHKDIAVLMRMNAFSQDFERVFRLNHIPYTVVGGNRFFDRIEVKDIISYLSFSFNPRNITSFTRIINVPRRGIGEVWLKRILEYNRDQNESLIDSLGKIVRNESSLILSAAMNGKIKDFYNICTHVKKMVDDKQEIADVLSFIYDATHYFDYLKEHHFQDHEARWQNLGELLNIAKSRDKYSTGENTFFDENGEHSPRPDNSSSDMDDFNDSDIEEKIYDSNGDPNMTADFNSKRPRMKAPKAKKEPKVKEETILKKEPKEKDMSNFKNVKVEDFVENLDDYEARQQQPQQRDTTMDDISEGEDDGLNGEENSTTQKEFPESNPVVEFLEYCSLSSNTKEQEDAEGGRVTIATLHSSKGLEWPMTFIITCNSGVIPHSRCDSDEEGRLLYVGMTRSKFLLYCISPRNRDNWGQRQKEDPSYFLNGLKPSLYIRKPSEWTPELRAMLSKTIRRPIVDEEYINPTSSTQMYRESNSQQITIKKESSSTGDFRMDGFTSVASLGGFTSAAKLDRSSTVKKELSQKSTSRKKTSKATSVKKEPATPPVKKEPAPPLVTKEVAVKEEKTTPESNPNQLIKPIKRRTVAPPKKNKVDTKKVKTEIKEDPEDKAERENYLLR